MRMLIVALLLACGGAAAQTDGAVIRVEAREVLVPVRAPSV